MLCEAAGLKRLMSVQTLDSTQNEGGLPVQECLNLQAFVAYNVVLYIGMSL